MEREKYLSEKPNHIVHCSSCRGVILKNAKIDKEKCNAEFLMRCPHCQRAAEIFIDIDKDLISVKKLHDSDN